MAGGDPAQVGAARVERADGRVVDLPSTAKAELGPGDVFVIETPGGGGYGLSELVPKLGIR
jgi:5-oxoprolinase (ATP-hydrolysing)